MQSGSQPGAERAGGTSDLELRKVSSASAGTELQMPLAKLKVLLLWFLRWLPHGGSSLHRKPELLHVGAHPRGRTPQRPLSRIIHEPVRHEARRLQADLQPHAASAPVGAWLHIPVPRGLAQHHGTARFRVQVETDQATGAARALGLRGMVDHGEPEPKLGDPVVARRFHDAVSGLLPGDDLRLAHHRNHALVVLEVLQAVQDHGRRRVDFQNNDARALVP
mmetsp:Transcript_80806/g.208053  ORF Transcript_80806/g.208053 Transcript_80806/m.208053 type:complete len:221 (-) Transcript_80806:423-1085(-)